MTNEEAKRIIEAILFTSEKPLQVSQIKEVLEGLDGKAVRGLILELAKELEEQNRSIKIIEIAGGFQMVTDPAYAPWLKKLYKSRQTERLSHPALETLSIIAYRQPVTRPDIEQIRGVNVDGVLKTLLERNLVRITGRKETLGRPMLYGTTNEFLQYFGLNSLLELPPLNEFTEKDLSQTEISKTHSEDRGKVETQKGDSNEGVERTSQEG